PTQPGAGDSALRPASGPTLSGPLTVLSGLTSEKWVMRFFFSHRRQRAVPGAYQSLGRQGKDLFPHLLFGQIPRLFAASDRAGEDGVADDGHVRGIFGPGPDDVR